MIQPCSYIFAREKYRTPGVNNLIYTVNDVTPVSGTLQKRGGYSPDCILDMTDASSHRLGE